MRASDTDLPVKRNLKEKLYYVPVLELENENADLKKKLNLVTEELRELKLKKGNSKNFLTGEK